MPKKILNELIDQQQDWLDPLGESLAGQVYRMGGAGFGSKVLDFLHGVWLGHPLHPALSDVPVGAWTVGAVMDVIDTFSPNETVRRCADGAIAVGVLGGMAAAPAGTADWHHTIGHNRRVGLVHGMLNTSALGLYIASLLLRRGKGRPLGVSLGLLGYSVASLSAYIGGELVFGSGVGVNRSAWEAPPQDYVPVLAEAELQEDKPRRVAADGTPLVLVRRHGLIYALEETCTHLGGPLSEGELADDSIVCPWHGSRFALEDGRVLAGPATFAQTAYDVRVRNGQIEVRPRR